MANWALLAALRDSGGRLTRSQLESSFPGADPAQAEAALGRLGYAFKLSSRGTLALTGWPDELRAEEISAALRTDTVGRAVEVHRSVKSTNDLARAEAARAREGVAIFAEEQSSGRGRFGRVWSAPASSSLLFSVPLRATGAVRPETLALAGAAAVAESVIDLYRLPARIRWPNDVVVDELKISGTLVESIAASGARGSGSPARWLILGTGVNVNLDAAALPPAVAATATSISALTRARADRALLARAILRRLDLWWEVLKSGDAARLSQVCRTLSSIIGTFVTVESAGKRHAGRVVDIDAEVGLVLQLSGGPTRAFAPAETTIIHH